MSDPRSHARPSRARVLLSSVRDDPDVTARLLDAMPPGRLDHLVQAARFHGVVGYLSRAMERSNVSTTRYAELARDASADAVTGHLRALGDLARLRPLLGEIGVPWLVVKGPVVTEVLHKDPALRAYVDLDVLVRAADFSDAVTHLEHSSIELLDRNWPLIRRHVAGELHFALPLGTPLDLHWQLIFHAQTRASYAIEVGEMVDRARDVDLGPVTVATTDPADTVIHLAVHAATAGGHRLIWLKDLELALAACDMEAVVERANAWRVGPVVGVMLGRVRDVLGAAVATDVLTALVPSAAWRGLLRTVDAGWPAQRVTARGSPAKLIARAARGDVRHSAAAALRQASRLRAWNLRQPRRSTSGDVFAEVPDDLNARGDYFAAVTRQGFRPPATAHEPPTISVVIDNFNYARYLDRAVRSALAQSYPVDVVVVDDGSTDESLDVLAAFGDQITVVKKPNGGQASALNAGVSASTGDVVLFLDADDVLHPEAATRVAEALAPGVAKVHFRLGAIGEDDRDLGFTNPPTDRPLADGDVVPELLARGRYDTPVMSGNAYTRWTLDRVMPIPEGSFRISADGYLAATAPFHGRVRAIEAVLGGYRIHGGNAWAQDALYPERLNGFVAHDLARHEALEAEARRTGAGAAAPLERNPAHQRARVASWRLSRTGHPIASDSRWSLIRAGVPAQLAAPLPVVKRLLYSVWYLVVAAAPTPVARWAVVQFYMPQRRARVTGAVSRAARRPPAR